MKSRYTSKIKSLALRLADRLHLYILKDSYNKNYTKNVLRAMAKPNMVNIGAGSFRHPLWINLDYGNDFYGVVQNKNMLSHDLSSMKVFPFIDSTIDIYYCSHVIEHLNDKCVAKIFSEVYRSLKPDGVFRLVCPDMEYLYKNLKSDDGEICMSIRPWGDKYKSRSDAFLEHFCTILVHDKEYRDKVDIKDDEFYECLEQLEMNHFFNFYCSRLPENSNKLMPHGHCNWFSFDKTREMLKAAGFTKIRRSEFGKSKSVALRSPTLFDGTSPEISLYVEAEK